MAEIQTRKAAEGLRRQIEAVRSSGHDIEMCDFIDRLLAADVLEWQWDLWNHGQVQAWTVSTPASRSVLVPTSCETQAAIMELVHAGEVAFAVDTVGLNIIVALAKDQKTQ